MQKGHKFGGVGVEYYGLNVCVPSDSHVEALTPSVAIFGGGTSKAVIKVK